MLPILLSTLVTGVASTAQIQCYSCITPRNGANFDMLCKDTVYCTGAWCTKGPDARSSGILHGCAEVAPLTKPTSTCIAVNGSTGLYYNCYCNNIDFCNSAPSTLSLFVPLMLISLFLLVHLTHS